MLILKLYKSYMGSLSLTEAPSPTAKLLEPLFDEFWFDERELHLRHRNTRMFGEIGVPVIIKIKLILSHSLRILLVEKSKGCSKKSWKQWAYFFQKCSFPVSKVKWVSGQIIITFQSQNKTSWSFILAIFCLKNPEEWNK